jgi:hypothetical protein
LSERTIEILDRMIGLALAQSFYRNGPKYLSPIARRVRVIESWTYAELLDDAADAGRLSEADRNVLCWVDVALTGQRRQDGESVYFVVEATADIQIEDVVRAATHAALLEKLGRPVVPVVAGRRFDVGAATVARERGVWSLLDDELTAPRDAPLFAADQPPRSATQGGSGM